MELKTSKDIFIYLAYPLFDVKDIQKVVNYAERTIRYKANSLGLYKNKNLSTKQKVGNKSNSWRGYGDIPSSVFNRIKAKAKSRGHCFKIDIKYIWDLFQKQNGKCAYTGIDLFFGNTAYNSAYYREGNASLDRIDSEKGYEINNLQWVHKDVNMMKQKLPHNRFVEYCKLIAKNHKDK